jgi:hypothetical protein
MTAISSHGMVILSVRNRNIAIKDGNIPVDNRNIEVGDWNRDWIKSPRIGICPRTQNFNDQISASKTNHTIATPKK